MSLGLPLTISRTSAYAPLYLRAAAIAATILSVFFALNFLATFVPRELIVTNLQANKPSFREVITSPLGSAEFPRFDNNDCLVLSFVSQKYGSRWSEAFSPKQPIPEPFAERRGNEPQICLRLLTLLDQADPADPNSQPYHRYLHGHRLYARVAAAFLSPHYLSLIPSTLTILALLSVCAVAMRRRGMRDLAYASIAGTLLLFNGFWLFSFYFTHALSDLVLGVFVAASYHFKPFIHGPKSSTTAVAIFASFVAIFEFLTGGAPCGLAALLAFVAIDTTEDKLRTAFHLGVIFFGIIAVALILKIAASGYIDGSGEVEFAIKELGRWLPGHPATVSPSGAARFADLGIPSIDHRWIFKATYAAMLLASVLPLIGFGFLWIGFAVLAGSLIATVYSLVRLPKSDTWYLLLGSALIIPVWNIIFLNHTLTHANWMVRPFGWFTAVALFLFWMRPNTQTRYRSDSVP